MNKTNQESSLKTRLFFIFVMAILLSALSGCAKLPQQAVQKTEEPTGYMGEWTIQRVVAYGPAGTYSVSDAEKQVGKKVHFGVQEARMIGDQPSSSVAVIKNPVYSESSITQEAFIAEYKISLRQFGIVSENVKTVLVSGAEGTIASTLLIKDNNTIILVSGGTYFEITR